MSDSGEILDSAALRTVVGMIKDIEYQVQAQTEHTIHVKMVLTKRPHRAGKKIKLPDLMVLHIMKLLKLKKKKWRTSTK